MLWTLAERSSVWNNMRRNRPGRAMWQGRLWPSEAAAEKPVGEKAKAVEFALQALAKKAVAEKAKGMELVAVKALAKKAVGEKAEAVAKKAVGEKAEAVAKKAVGEKAKAMAKKAVGEKANAVEVVAAKVLVKKAVGGKAKAVEVVAAKALEEQVCAPKATITMQQSKVGKNTATGQISTLSDTETVAKHKVVHEVTICRNTVPKLLMWSHDKHSKAGGRHNHQD